MAVRALSATKAYLYEELASFQKEFKKPVLSYLSKKVHEVALLALEALPGLSYLVKGYTEISHLLSYAKHHVIQYERLLDVPAIYKGAHKEIGSFFKNSEVEGYWDIHDESFNTLTLHQISELLQKVYDHTEDKELFQAQVAQILSKKLVSGCWHELKEGFAVKIPILDEQGNKKWVQYLLDKKFDLWQDIPAFGFVDLEGKEAPMLIFRSTNPNTSFADSWPSILANLHPKGPAWKLYEESHQPIEDWLEKQSHKVRLMGYSQGAALASYFLTYKSPWISQKEHEPCYLFDGPGISKKVFSDWKKLSSTPKVYHYLNRGDFVPKVGEGFIGKVYELSVPRPLSAIEAHRSMSLLSPVFRCSEVDVEKELYSKVRQVFSYLQMGTSHLLYPLLRKYIVPKIQKVFYGLHFST